jgi:hypothetical protein
VQLSGIQATVYFISPGAYGPFWPLNIWPGRAVGGPATEKWLGRFTWGHRGRGKQLTGALAREDGELATRWLK